MGAALQGDNKWVRRGRGVGDAASYAGSGGAVRGYYGLPHQCAHWFAMTFLGGAVRAGRCGHRPLRKACRAGPMCPAVEGTAYVGGGTHGCRPTGDNRRVRRVPAAGCGHPALRVRGKGARCGRDVEDAVPYAEHEVPACGSSGKSAKRRRWREKRAGFEEVPRLAATTVDGNRLARRRAIADPYA